MISVLTRVFGLRHLELVEDAVQESLLKALRLWSFNGVPSKPAAWLMEVAKNHALDHLRRDARWLEPGAALGNARENSEGPGVAFTEEEIRDGQLRMIFACCHPAIAAESQVAFTLKILCGFSVHEIARAFLVPNETIAKRLTRARQRLQTSALPFEIPSGPELGARLDSVLDVLYLLFSEGYNASQGEALIRRELCDEAIRLTSLLLENPASAHPKVHALLALFLLQRSRFSARLDHAGEILLLQEQDRATWDRNMICRGMAQLEAARGAPEISEYHLQAGIAACHCLAGSYEATDWAKILFFYDVLLELNASPIIALNRAVALSKVRGAEAGLAAIAGLGQSADLKNYYLLYAVRAELQRVAAQQDAARENLEQALRLTSIPAEQNFLARRLRELAPNPGSS